MLVALGALLGGLGLLALCLLAVGFLEGWCGADRADAVAQIHLEALRAASRITAAAYVAEREIYAEAARHTRAPGTAPAVSRSTVSRRPTGTARELRRGG
jgi:hypothetical protein